MAASPNDLTCDGCGLPASAQHIANRLRRLELSTRFRPVHIGILFVSLAPAFRPEDDFYDLSESKKILDPLLEALEIFPPAERATSESHDHSAHSIRLAEFQRRGHYLAYLSECPIREDEEPTASTIARLAPTLIRRIRFNYRPKYIAPLGHELLPLLETLRAAGIGPILARERGQILPIPRTGDREWPELFRRAVDSAAPREYLSSGYDRIQLTHTDRDSGAGGNL